MLYRKNVIVILLLLSAVIFGASTMQQQQPQQPPEPIKNLKVLPKNISHATLDSTMKSFRTALGVRCNFCHVPIPGSNPQKMDFASDAKKEKLTARKMLKMVMGINKKYFDKKYTSTATLPVTCITCHKGKEKPAKTI
jgi:hypothetical protein